MLARLYMIYMTEVYWVTQTCRDDGQLTGTTSQVAAWMHGRLRFSEKHVCG